MKHFVKTANGISEDYIEASDSLPLSGSGEGNGGGPICWHAHMEPLLQAYAANNPGFSFEDPAQAIHFIQWVIGYVDDNSLILTFRGNQTTAEALSAAQAALTSWRKLLQITGGDLALEKCVYSYMGWEHKKGKEVLSTM